MGRAPCCDKTVVKKGPWSPEEDAVLKTYIESHGTGGNWIALPHKIGLNRCGKSCRLRWLNYLRPNIKHGGFTEEEENIICSLYMSIGSRWSIIASQLPGRTDNDIKNYWNTRLKKKLLGKQRKVLQEAQQVSFSLKQDTALMERSVQTENRVSPENPEALNQTLYNWSDHSSFAVERQANQSQEPIKNPVEFGGATISWETNKVCLDASSYYYYYGSSTSTNMLASSSASLNSVSSSTNSPPQTSQHNINGDQEIFAGFENFSVELLDEIINSTAQEVDHYGMEMMNNVSSTVDASTSADQSNSWDDISCMVNYPYDNYGVFSNGLKVISERVYNN